MSVVIDEFLSIYFCAYWGFPSTFYLLALMLMLKMIGGG
jgi:hypothetical protein